MTRAPLFPLALLASCRGCAPDDTAFGPAHWAEAGDAGVATSAFAADGQRLLVGTAEGMLASADGGASFTAAENLPEGPITFTAALPGADLAWVEGWGLYRDAGAGWAAVASPPDSPLLGLVNPRAVPVPFCVASEAGHTWLAAAGGLFQSDDDGDTWSPVDLGDAGFNLLFSSVAARGGRVAAAAFQPAGLLPAQYSDLLSTTLVVSDDGGESWEDAGEDLPVRYPSGLALDAGGRLWLAAMDGGLFREAGEGWESLGGPSDALAVDVDEAGASVLSASRGAWRWEGGVWTALDVGPMVGLAGEYALAVDGRVLALAPGEGEPPVEGGATVHVALSFHVNLYHSYRGDTNDDDGYGIDLDVMRAELDWLDAHPELHADWDFDDAFSLHGWLQTDGADVLARIQARVAAGQDAVRLMSWNNGAMANHNPGEFAASITWAQEGLEASFGGWDPGVQPQECMVSPEHLGWYRELGVAWITLFNSATPFTALQGQVALPDEAAFAPFTLTHGEDSLTAVPAYHHGDLLDHGGLYGWVEQLHGARDGDQLLLIHFDADAETWVGFDQELEPLLELDHVRFTTLQGYLDEHEPVASVELAGDLADGTGDGFQSWGEKAFDHEIATGIALAREMAAHAAAVAGGDPDVEALLAAALPPRLLALSTTHFGLAAPWLHPDRQQAARDRVAEAQAGALEALAAAGALATVDAGRILVRNTRDSAGAALLEIPLRVLAADWVGPEGVHVADEDGAELPIAVQVVEEGAERVSFTVSVVIQLDAQERRMLRWGYDATVAPVTGTLTEDPALLDLPALAPFTECDGALTQGQESQALTLALDERGALLTGAQAFDLDLCAAPGTVIWTRRVYEGLPGVVLKVNGQLGAPADPDDAESVALSPVACDGPAGSLSWRTFGGSDLTRPVRDGLWTWNGQAADGQVVLHCDDGVDIGVSHRVTERDSLAFAPLRTLDGRALLAPLGTLWGPPPRHAARHLGGHGLGDVSVGLVGSQFRPAAPDWSGTVPSYRLLVGEDIDPGTLDLFAHPPFVKVGGGS
ncbi:MAG: hypothetical protein ABIO70_28275 [Pseudomonadota bacterium]